MKTALRRTVPAALVIAGIVVVSGTTGAVAGSLITSKDIKDDTITTADIKNLTIEPSDTSKNFDKYTRRVGGYKVIHRTLVVEDGVNGVISIACPGETTILGMTAWWTNSLNSPQIDPTTNGAYNKAVKVYGPNGFGGSDTLHGALYCGRTATN